MTLGYDGGIGRRAGMSQKVRNNHNPEILESSRLISWDFNRRCPGGSCVGSIPTLTSKSLWPQSEEHSLV